MRSNLNAEYNSIDPKKMFKKKNTNQELFKMHVNWMSTQTKTYRLRPTWHQLKIYRSFFYTPEFNNIGRNAKRQNENNKRIKIKNLSLLLLSPVNIYR